MSPIRAADPPGAISTWHDERQSQGQGARCCDRAGFVRLCSGGSATQVPSLVETPTGPRGCQAAIGGRGDRGRLQAIGDGRGPASSAAIAERSSPPAEGHEGGGGRWRSCSGSGLAGCVHAGGDLPISAPTTVTACAAPGVTPKFIAVLLQGINSSLETGTSGAATFNPATQSYCTSPDGKSPPDNPQVALQDMADGWLNWNCPVGVYAPCKPDSQATVSYPNDLIDALANAGGWVLPFSYRGASLSGSSANPVFSLTGYNAGNVANNDPRYGEPPILDAEVSSIHRLFPSIPIIVIGHSNGGLIAEQWWVRYRPTGVAHIFSLDSPINGVGRAGPLCQVGLCGAGGVGATTANAYISLWQGSASDPTDGNAALVSLSGKDPRYTASGTYGDPLYDVGDAVVGTPPHNGILSSSSWTRTALPPRTPPTHPALRSRRSTSSAPAGPRCRALPTADITTSPTGCWARCGSTARRKIAPAP